ncbi:hypothetical protein ACFSFW_24045 [Fredinandcohnia salidurans]|uniref:Uncharacterized protein n=1 Tax=Fredinandcohnia salidurans TaxID=2595041 RepID=A0ABW4MUR2_9BACI
MLSIILLLGCYLVHCCFPIARTIRLAQQEKAAQLIAAGSLTLAPVS